MRRRSITFAIRWSVIGWAHTTPRFAFDDHSVQLALRTPDGPVGLAIDQLENNIGVRGWGAGAGWIAQRLEDLLGFQDSPEEFQPSDRVVKSLVRRFSGMHLPRLPRVFDRVVQVILLQRVAWRDGIATWKRLVQHLGENAPGPDHLTLPPSPKALASTPYYELVSCGVPHRQARTIQQVAFHVRRIEEAAGQGVESFTKILSAIPGIGPWTIGYLRGSALADADAILPGDFNLRHSVAWVLAGEERAEEERMLELLEPYRGHRFRVIRFVWMKAAKPPRRGPRR